MLYQLTKKLCIQDFFHAKGIDKLQLVNFESEHMKVDTAAIQEILRFRLEALFFWLHP